MANLTSYGFVGYEHLADERIADGNVRVVNDAIVASLAEHNRVVNAALDELVERTTEYSTRYKLPGGGTLQPLDDLGNPVVVRAEGYYDVAFPIQGGATAWGDNRVSRALMTVAEADRYTFDALLKDADWMRRHILAALLDNTSWSFEDKAKGALTVQPLANDDAVTFLRRSGQTATDNHYYAQADAISDAANPFETFYDELNEHPENAGPYVAYVATNLKASIRGLGDFVDEKNEDVDPGALAPSLLTRVDRGMGSRVLGYVNGIYVVEWELMPSNYGVVVARGARTKPLRMREYPAAALQGFFPENFSPDGNLVERRMIRYAGFGAYNRVGAMSFRIGNASYAVPADYSTPMAV